MTWEPRLTTEPVTDGLPLIGAIALGIVIAVACCLLGILLGLVILAAAA